MLQQQLQHQHQRQVSKMLEEDEEELEQHVAMQPCMWFVASGRSVCYVGVVQNLTVFGRILYQL